MRLAVSAALCLVGPAWGITGCGESVRAAGPTPAGAEANVDQLFDAFRTRFTNVDISPKFEVARTRLAQSALIPSRIFNDPALWEVRPSASLRTMYIAGSTSEGRYQLDTRASNSEPARAGDTRHVIALEQIGESVFRWDTRVVTAIGRITADETGALITALLAAPDGRTDRELRDDYRGSFPRATVALGRGFAIDSLHAVPGAASTTSVALTATFHPELMRPGFPAFADYLEKYLAPAKYHFLLADRSGVALLDITGRDRALTLRYRVQQGKLTSLFGPPRQWPDSLQLTGDLSVKVKIFTVGFHALPADFTISTTAHERAWTVTAQHEPKWDLPFITERLLRSPLRRPFEGSGVVLRWSVRDSSGSQTVIDRRARVEVQESTIMRFLGSLGARAVGDLDNRVELEQHRFLRDAFSALQTDVRAFGSRARSDER